MPISTRSRSVVSKEVVLDESYDPWVEIVGNCKAKVEQVKLLDLDLID